MTELYFHFKNGVKLANRKYQEETFAWSEGLF